MPSLTKELMLQEVAREFEGSRYAFVSNFESLDVAKLTELRQKLGKSSRRSMMIKHSLAKKIFENRKYSGTEQFLKGPVLFTFGKDDPQIVSKAIIEFAKEN